MSEVVVTNMVDYAESLNEMINVLHIGIWLLAVLSGLVILAIVVRELSIR